MVSRNLLVLEDSEDNQFTLNRVVSNTKFQTLIRQLNSAIWPEVSEGSSAKKATVEFDEYKLIYFLAKKANYREITDSTQK